ncbi:NAD(P)-dependent oxidoreductase [Desulfosporosinus sp. PR]|uniref:NAD(P)-dependent oxidoreductase n=1 Tax=Candidatus Desulfosporosinus nitrosoreducens TaxID=3401928 RepID=UPI0027EF75CA|nr:NAD(P)-dependent oxidoreductase [Desulfosporosinus sp. PR]MDQ7094507.1 NAD(P)-dependent oxidoreductase [Desulfosporosinus sp. PR]
MLVIGKNSKVGFVGTGVMGKSMASHILKAGYQVNIYTRTKDKADSLLKAGAVWQDNVADLAKNSDVIISMVGYPKDVEEIYLGEKGIIKHAKSGSYLVDMTTSSPSLAQRIYQEARAKTMYAIDAPVSGGDVGAKEARLAIMVGGDEEVFNALVPILSFLGKNIIYQGSAGAGQHTKMCNQIAIASNMIGVCEAVAYAQKSGLNPETVLKSIESGAAGSWSLSNLAPRMLANDFAPGFYVKHFIKDMTIALDSAQEMGLLTPGLELAKSLYDKLAAAGEENSGTQSLYKLYSSL